LILATRLSYEPQWTSAAARAHSPNTGKRIAIVGAGPAGLASAHDLALLGHTVVIFDSAPVAGGMLRLGVPEYRLPRELIELEIQAILALGPTLKLNQALNRDFTLADLRRDFDAVLIAIGTYKTAASTSRVSSSTAFCARWIFSSTSISVVTIWISDGACW
jgi:NADPH-dependent glutamate synthase beta subunit-like oxidoreductase